MAKQIIYVEQDILDNLCRVTAAGHHGLKWETDKYIYCAIGGDFDLRGEVVMPFTFMGYDEKKLTRIVDEWERSKWDSEMLAAKDKKVPTKHIMTRAEVIDKIRNDVFGLTDTGQATKWADFFIAAGMLEIKEEEEKPIFELKYPSGVHAYKIWSNGRVEGFNDGVIVINRISELVAKLKQIDS